MAERSDAEAGKDVVDKTLGAHRECMRLVSAVEECLDRKPDRDGRWLADLQEKLPLLAQTLREHFEEEQQEYMYRELPVEAPRFASRLRKLEAEHGQILETIQGIIEGSESLQQVEIPEAREFNARVQLLVATIRRHEAEENEILVNKYWNDVGVGD